MNRYNNNPNDPDNKARGNFDNQDYDNVPPASQSGVSPDQPTTAYTPPVAGQQVPPAQPPYEPIYTAPPVQPVPPVSNPSYYSQPTSAYYAAPPPPPPPDDLEAEAELNEM